MQQRGPFPIQLVKNTTLHSRFLSFCLKRKPRKVGSNCTAQSRIVLCSLVFLIIITFSSAPFIFSGSFYDTEMGRISGSFEPSFFAPILTAPETSSLGGKNSKLKEEETIKTMTLAYPLHSVILFKGYGRLKEEYFFTFIGQ